MPAKPKRLPRAVREQQMMDAAVAVFAARGYHSASMDEIAERAGISKPMVYLYLGSKEDLFLASLRREVARFTEAITAGADRTLPPDEQLWQGLEAFFTVVAEHRDAWAVLHQHALAHGEPFAGEVSAMRRGMIALVTELIEDATRSRGSRPAAEQNARALAYALVGACEALADWSLEHPDEVPAITSSRAMNFAWMGLDRLLHGDVWHTPAVPAVPPAS